MFRFLKYVKIFYYLLQRPTPAEDDMPWTHRDAKNLAIFFESDTGKKLSRSMRNMDAKNCSQYSIKPDNAQYNAGYACGGKSIMAHVFSLSAKLFQPQMEEYEALPFEAEEDDLDNDALGRQ